MNQNSPERLAAARVVLDRRRRLRDEHLDAARAFVAALDPTLGIRSAVVFGSVARGDFNVWSDIDVLVVADELPVKPQDRSAVLGSRPRVSPIGWTTAELRRQLAAGNAIAREALETGILIAGVSLEHLAGRRGLT